MGRPNPLFIMTDQRRATRAGQGDRVVAHRPLRDDPDFGRPGWRRTYAQAVRA